MEEFTVFERTFDKQQESDGLFVRLTCSEDNELQYVKVKSVTFNESIGLMIPTMIIDFVDATGDFVNHNRLNTDAIYTLYFGRSMLMATETTYKIFDIQHSNGTQGRTKNMGFKVMFSHSSWEESAAVKRSKGWNLRKYSDVVSEIVSNKGYESVDIETSLRTVENIIQMNETDNSLIRKIQKRATPVSQDGHYVFCGTLDNRFFFKSTYELIKAGMDKRKDDKMVVLRLGGQPSQRDREKLTVNNENVPVGFTGFGASENYAGHVANGATAVEASYYDWNNRTYIRKTKGFKDLNATQLSEWSLIRENTNYVSKKVFGGRDRSVVDEAINQMSETSLAMQDVYINLEGQLELHCGDIVEVIIPTNEDSEVPYNEMYSGYYMIKDIKHMMALSKSTDFVSQLTLTRNGMDAKDMKGYVRSKNGRTSL